MDSPQLFSDYMKFDAGNNCLDRKGIAIVGRNELSDSVMFQSALKSFHSFKYRLLFLFWVIDNARAFVMVSVINVILKSFFKA